MGRDLYLARKNDWGINPLTIADDLLLLESITLDKKGVNLRGDDTQKPTA